MTVWVEGKRAFYLGTQAHLVQDDRECAWAENHIVHNDAHAWVLGRYVEADRANNNRQYLDLDGLRLAQPTLTHAPLNINHDMPIVGSFVASELVYPTEEAAGEVTHPYLEALGVVWKAFFPHQFNQIKEASNNGSIFFSMETVPKEISCQGSGGCGGTYPYDGIQSQTYCRHLNERSSERHLLEPHFTAGALILPPVRPGWSNADVKALVAKHAEDAERVYAEVAADAPHLEVKQWESAMQALMYFAEYGRSFTGEERHALAKSGKALPDGSYPIVNAQDLHNAIQAIGRAKNPGKAKSHIIARAKALGLTGVLPESWKS